jgi:hypothetical protein
MRIKKYRTRTHPKTQGFFWSCRCERAQGASEAISRLTGKAKLSEIASSGRAPSSQRHGYVRKGISKEASHGKIFLTLVH